MVKEEINMAIKTLVERIEEVQASISEVLTSQELSTQGGSVARARLDFLTKYEARLLDEYELQQAAASGGFMNKVRFRRPI